MGTPILAAGRGAKVYQGGRGTGITSHAQQIKPGQTASLRPAANMSTNLSGHPSGHLSPPRLPMDYRSAVSPARLGGPLNLMAQNNFGAGPEADPNLSYPLDNVNFMDNAAYDNYVGDILGGQTQAIARQLDWRQMHQMQQAHGQATTDEEEYDDMEETDEDMQQLQENQNQASASNTVANTDKGKSPIDLPDIPENTEGESESDEEDIQESSYIDRHRAWVDVLDAKDPAHKEANGDFEMDVGELLTAVDDIIETSSHEGKIATDTLYLDSKLFAEGIRQLQNHSLIVHTVDLRVTMAYFEKWAEQTIHQLLGVTVVSICQLDPFCFHIVLDSGKAKAHIFANSPLKMGTKMVFPLPWDTRFSTRDLKSRAVPVWLELFDVHPGLLKFGLNMLRKIGPIIYAAKNTETQRINIVRGEFGTLRLPDACFNYRQRGHFARACPLNQLRREAQQSEEDNTNLRRAETRDRGQSSRQAHGTQEEADGGPVKSSLPNDTNEGFKVVCRKQKPKFHAPEIKKSMKVDNRYGILEEPDEIQEILIEEETNTASVTSRKVQLTSQESHGSKGTSGVSSSSGNMANGQGRSPNGPGIFIREIVDLTKNLQDENNMEKIQARTTGVKHHQEDREKHLSSIGAITPTDSDGRKKLKNRQGPVQGSNQQAGVPKDGSQRGAQLTGGPASRGQERCKTTYNQVDIFAFQELKAHEFVLENNMRLIAEGGTVVVDYRESGWGGGGGGGGPALLIKPRWKVVECGVKGDGRAAWAMIEPEKGNVGIIRVYAPHSEQGRMELWDWIKGTKGSGSLLET
ncbi:hypothetical protein R1sor_000651 [Riccia sorocarpa]|uniref:DUF4283 domain-containing protein n=1 Tax=Riccia sorocarpa TaxID=122646 RepID=A0ABD3GXQ0_9MARC